MFLFIIENKIPSLPTNEETSVKEVDGLGFDDLSTDKTLSATPSAQGILEDSTVTTFTYINDELLLVLPVNSPSTLSASQEQCKLLEWVVITAW